MNYLAEIRPRPESVLLVGHEPYLSGFIALLCAGDGGLRLALKKGGLCRLDAETLRHGQCATLEWLFTPRHFAPKRANGA